MDSWVINQNYRYYINSTIKGDNSFAFFDLDETLITSFTGHNPAKFNENIDDWIYLGAVIEELKKLVNENYNIVIVTNQSYMSKIFGKVLQEKFENIRIDLLDNGIPVSFLISTGPSTKRSGIIDEYRKPNPGLFKLLLDILNIEKVNNNSFMCGDSAFEEDKKNEFPAYDWGNDDLKFAESCNIDFYRPIEIFPSMITYEKIQSFTDFDVLILVGNMGSGKTTLSKKICEIGQGDFVCLESDKFKSIHKKMHKEYLSLLGKTKIIIDATNPSEERRAEYYKPALEKNLKVAVLWFIRNGRPWNNLRNKPIKEFVYGNYSNKFEYPAYILGINNIRIY